MSLSYLCGVFLYILTRHFLVYCQDDLIITTTQKPCADYYGDSWDICLHQELGGVIELPFRYLNFSTPADPERSCKEYKPEVSCAVSVQVNEGQKILVRAGENFRFKDPTCKDCDRCDSFKLNAKCVPKDLNKLQKVELLQDKIVTVNFTSRLTASTGESGAQLQLRAIGCSFQALVRDQTVKLELVNNTDYTEETESYQARASCESGSVLPNQEESMIVTCFKKSTDGGLFYYEWDADELLECNMPKAVSAAIIAVIVIVIIIAIILGVLGCCGCFPCQKKDDTLLESAYSSYSGEFRPTSKDEEEGDEMIPMKRETAEPASVTIEYNKHDETADEEPDVSDRLSTSSDKPVPVLA